ncbi:hypothetical protein BJ508DRAFT_412940 [Ascobolus immersus RN42]|uniref:Uncharacterized protein n=1 Tax=Ascobolus immersus RN42 TaxID=1160509 RepID=A0A3N4IDN8_ASCIM|nr:hypothetical protein BJ508DRAFT_412940 [Ascobolus immersus RN42]
MLLGPIGSPFITSRRIFKSSLSSLHPVNSPRELTNKYNKKILTDHNVCSTTAMSSTSNPNTCAGMPTSYNTTIFPCPNSDSPHCKGNIHPDNSVPPSFGYYFYACTVCEFLFCSNCVGRAHMPGVDGVHVRISRSGPSQDHEGDNNRLREHIARLRAERAVAVEGLQNTLWRLGTAIRGVSGGAGQNHDVTLDVDADSSSGYVQVDSETDDEPEAGTLEVPYGKGC